MNIFVLDPNPAIAASLHCDQHLHKMILESAQMVSTAHTPFVFAGPAIISIRPGSTIEHYKQYYRKKHINWLLDKGAGMTYKGRSVPDFMADLISPT